MKKKSEKDQRHWDDIMVKVIIIVSALAILILLADFAVTSGKAVATPERIKDILDNSEMVVGNGNCNDICGNERTCILAIKENERNNMGFILGKCTTRSTGVTCVCAK